MADLTSIYKSTMILNSFCGKQIDLNELNESKLLLFFNKNCLGCTGRAIPFAYELMSEHTKLSIHVIHSDFGLTKTNIHEINELFSAGKSPFPIYIDKDASLYKHFQCEGVPHWILLDRKNNVIRSIFGSQTGAKNRLTYAIEEVIKS